MATSLFQLTTPAHVGSCSNEAVSLVSSQGCALAPKAGYQCARLQLPRAGQAVDVGEPGRGQCERVRQAAVAGEQQHRAGLPGRRQQRAARAPGEHDAAAAQALAAREQRPLRSSRQRLGGFREVLLLSQQQCC